MSMVCFWVMVLGGAIYFISPTKFERVTEIGRVMFFAGLLGFLLRTT